MAKSRKTKASADGATIPASHIAFQRFAVRNAFFAELPKVPTPGGEPKPERTPHQISISATVGLSDEGMGEVTLAVDVTPDPRFQPYNIKVQLTGVFSSDKAYSEELGIFCRKMGPTLLFPFVRQVVSALTADGRYGRVMVQPLNLQAGLKDENWVESKPEPQQVIAATDSAKASKD